MATDRDDLDELSRDDLRDLLLMARISQDESFEVIAKLRQQVNTLANAIRWFADDKNWREEELSEGTHFAAEWQVGFDPREIAKKALNLAAA